MRECVNSLIKDNPEFNHHLYDDDDCREFIKNNFNDDVLNAYDSLIPGAYKADLWRYCILYKKGGIYLDIKYKCYNNFKLINLTDNEYFVRDLEYSGHGIYNAFMICKPGNNKCLKCINQIVKYVKNKEYTDSIFKITGPLLLINYFTEKELKDFVLKLNKKNSELFILFNNNKILTTYPEYRDEQKKFSNKDHYLALWNKRKVYKSDII
jgi:mannosyltransferase OCH1-like enzyme